MEDVVSRGNALGKALSASTITAYTLLTLTFGVAHSDSRASTFPNPGVAYQIPFDESSKQQADYLFGILKEHDYSQLEKHLRRYVPELKKVDEEDIEPLDDIVTLAVTATSPEVREAFELIVRSGIGIYSNVGKLAVTQYVSAITTKNFMVGQVEMLCNFGRALGIVFSLTGIAVIIMARDRLSLGKSAHRMASYVQKLEEELGQRPS